MKWQVSTANAEDCLLSTGKSNWQESRKKSQLRQPGKERERELDKQLSPSSSTALLLWSRGKVGSEIPVTKKLEGGLGFCNRSNDRRAIASAPHQNIQEKFCSPYKKVVRRERSF